jgi:hypothetical protein
MSPLSFYLPHAPVLLGLFLDSEDGGDTRHRNFGCLLTEMELFLTTAVRTSNLTFGRIHWIYIHTRAGYDLLILVFWR